MGSLEKCLRTAREAGVPKDQALRLVGSGYVPLPKQWKFHAKARLADIDGGPVDVGFGGARGPGKSHGVLSQAGLDDCQRVPKLKGLFLRQTGIAAKESFEDLVDKVLRGKVGYKKTGSHLMFENESKILLGGFKNQNDIDKYVGIEYDFIIVEELNQLTKDKYIKLRGSLRTSKTNWRPRMYTSFNPGGIGHAFVKKRYITGKLKETAFVPSTYKDNPYLNKEYIEYLEGLTGKLGEAWREGNFDLFAGKVFTELNEQVHIVKSFRLPPNTRWFGGYDWGFKHPFAFVLFGVTDDDRVYVTKYLKATGKSPIEQAEMIKKVIGEKEISIYAGTDLWAKRGGPTLHQQIRNALPQAVFIKAKTDRLQGLNEVRKYLSHEETETGIPAMKIFDRSREVYDCLEDMVHDERDGMKGEDVMKVDADENGEGGDDLYDSLRYGLMSRAFANPKPTKVVDRKSGEHLIQMIKEQERKRLALTRMM